MSTTTDGKKPKYQVLAERVAAELIPRVGVHRPLPPERELMELYRVSRMTVRAALAGLAEEGLVYRVQGSGTYVSDRHAITKSLHLTSFSEDIAARGMTPGSRVLSVERREATHEVALDLGIAPGDAVLALERVRTADGVPICIERGWLPGWLVDDSLALGGAESVYGFLEEIGAAPETADQEISAILMTAEDAELLGVQKDTAALLVTRIVYDRRGRRVEASSGVYRADSYHFSISVRRKAGS